MEPNTSILTVSERILLHLVKNLNVTPADIYSLPYSVCQNGISEIIRRNRSHVSVELNKLDRKGLIESWRAHVMGVDKKRKVYHITADGLKVYENLKKRLNDMGLSIDEAVALWNDHSTVNWKGLSVEMQEVMGHICVLRIPVSKDVFLNKTFPSLTTVENGMVYLNPEYCMNSLALIDDEIVRKWNSWAADLWIRKNDRERLYHLMKSDRNNDAVRLLLNKKNVLMNNSDRDLLRIIKDLDVPDRFIKKVAEIASEIAVQCRDWDYAKLCADELGDFWPNLICAEEAVYNGDIDIAEKFSENICQKNMAAPLPRIDMVLARCMLHHGNIVSASRLLKKAYEGAISQEDISRTYELFMIDSEISEALSDYRTALRDLQQASATCHSDLVKQEIYDISLNLIGVMKKSEDRIPFKSIDIRDVQVPNISDVPLKHGKPFESESPRKDRVFDSKWLYDLRPENSGTAEFHPFSIKEHLKFK